MALLSEIKKANDIKKLAEDDLSKLATEIRHEIIDVVYKNGGHLGSNLGVVDLTIALHYMFDPGKDLIVWDGSYQTYTHKILTGRREQLKTIRQFQGLSGFSWKGESEYDPFSFGHVGTALAAAYGACVADKSLGKKRKVIAIVGDGSMTSGVALESLNNIGASKQPVLVILNDNGFSIAKTVGAMSNYLNELRSKPLYSEFKKELHEMLSKIPLGTKVERALEAMHRGLRHAVLPNIFSAYGFQYYGPIDGHNIKRMLRILNNIKTQNRPVLLHLVTKKGKGHPDADKDPFGLHKPVEPVSAAPHTVPQSGTAACVTKLEPAGAKPPLKTKSYTRAFVDIINQVASEDKRVCAITAAMPDGTGLIEFAKKFPDRTFDVGISEQTAVAFACGLATAGMRPVVAIYSTFMQRAYDQIFQELCLQNLPVILATDRAGIAGEDGPTHHGLFDIGYMRVFPNITLMSPKDEAEFEAMFRFALTLQGPSAIRYPRENCPEIKAVEKKIELGKGEIICDGKDGFIFAYGVSVKYAIKARNILHSEGINVGVANARFAKPIDSELVAQLTNYPFVLCVEDHTYQGGFGSTVLEACSLKGLDTKRIKILAVPDRFIQHGPRDMLLNLLGLDEYGIAKACKILVQNPNAASEMLYMSRHVSSIYA